ncbi:vacuolar sorting protein [Stylonychia lemnae]|uniref:Vacuolar sorting protein n=1 Tax=Stylonychia lemnae TaxID=5949 RepID=A0A078A7U0_STYLE|nr:vacuolar sorting protein [Stylonychia lemnae]|eukprot:CDW78314.1 vacuolar sorting protein [Stylonychia lemnae]
MFKKLFGSSGGDKKKEAPPQVDPTQTMDRLSEQIENVQKRSKKIEMDMKRLLQEALEKKKAKDTRGAVFALKRKKMLEKEVAKLDGQMVLLEQQRLMIETSIQDAQVFQSLSAGSKTVDQLNKQLNIDDLEEVKERIEEQKADMDEKTDFFVRAGQMEDEDDLLDELNELEAELAEDELAQLEIGSDPLDMGAGPVKQPAARVQNKVQNEDDELRALEAMMS